jgi:hypothetical protein
VLQAAIDCFEARQEGAERGFYNSDFNLKHVSAGECDTGKSDYVDSACPMQRLRDD